MHSQSNDIFLDFPIKEFSGFRLREINAGDANGLFLYLQNEEIRRYIASEDLPDSLEEAEREVAYWSSLFRHRHSVYWAIADSETDHIIGTCGFNFWNRYHDKAELSYDLAVEYWNKGMMTNIVRFIIDYGFNVMKLNRISATATVNNMGSVKVLEKNGFEREGTLRCYKKIQGEMQDAYLYARINAS